MPDLGVTSVTRLGHALQPGVVGRGGDAVKGRLLTIYNTCSIVDSRGEHAWANRRTCCRARSIY